MSMPYEALIYTAMGVAYMENKRLSLIQASKDPGTFVDIIIYLPHINRFLVELPLNSMGACARLTSSLKVVTRASGRAQYYGADVPREFNFPARAHRIRKARP